MANQTSIKNITIMVCLVIVTISVLYMLVISPMIQNKALAKCLKQAETSNVGFGQVKFPSQVEIDKNICIKQYK